MTAHAALMVVEVRIAAARSLKDKRAAIRPIVDGARRRFSVAAAETGHADSHKRAELAFTAVSERVGHVDEVLATVERFVWSFPEIEVVEVRRHWMETD